MSTYIKWFNETGIDDVPEAGGKNASLGVMFSLDTGHLKTGAPARGERVEKYNQLLRRVNISWFPPTAIPCALSSCTSNR